MYLETLQEILVKAPTASAVRSALTVLVGLAQDSDFDAIRSLTQALASELGHDAQSDGFRHARSLDEFLKAGDIPPVLRIYALGFWPHKLQTSSLSRELGEALIKEDNFRGFQRLVGRKSPVQDELLKAYVLGALVNMLTGGVMSDLISPGTALHIVDDIRAKCQVVPGINSDSDFNFGRDFILRATGLSSFYSVVYHEMGHIIFNAASVGGVTQSSDGFPTPKAGTEVFGRLPALLEGAGKLKGKAIEEPGDPRYYTISTNVTLLCTYAEVAGGAYTHFSLMKAGGPIELRQGAAWAYLILSAIGVDMTQTAAVFSARGVFHFAFLGPGPDAAALRKRLKTLDLSQLLLGLEAGSAEWLDDLTRTSRIGKSESDVPVMLGVMPRQTKFYGPPAQLAWQDLQISQQLREDTSAVTEAPSEIKNGLLCLAVRCGDPAAVRSLLAAGAPARARLPDGYGCINMVGHSLCVVHDENGKSYYGPSAANLLEVIAILTSAGLDVNEPLDAAGNSLLHGAAGRNVELTQFFLSHRATVDIANGEGRTPLFEAIIFGPLAAVPALLDAGADVRIKSNDGTTPLHSAVERGEKQTITLLLERGAPVDAASFDGRTGLMLAAAWGHEAVVKLLLESGADAEAADTRGQTAMHFGVWSFRKEAQPAIFDALLAAGADINEETNDGATPLMLAASGGDLNAAKFLLRRQAKVNATDTRGNTALILALKSNAQTDKDLIQELLNHGADPLHVNAAGESPETLTQKDWQREINMVITEAAKKVRAKS